MDFAISEVEAIAAAQRRRPDRVTADVRLAQGSGITAVQTICASIRTPAIFVTGTGWEVRDAMSNAVVVPKPFAFADLERALATARGQMG